jgi:hypothetical protein
VSRVDNNTPLLGMATPNAILVRATGSRSGFQHVDRQPVRKVAQEAWLNASFAALPAFESRTDTVFASRLVSTQLPFRLHRLDLIQPPNAVAGSALLMLASMTRSPRRGRAGEINPEGGLIPGQPVVMNHDQCVTRTGQMAANGRPDPGHQGVDLTLLRTGDDLAGCAGKWR